LVSPVAGQKNRRIILLNAIVTIAIGLTVLHYVLRTFRSYEVSILGGSGVIGTAIFAVSILGERLALHQIVETATMLAGFFSGSGPP
jgi:multidrug transporter EmrE-like cation transporter